MRKLKIWRQQQLRKSHPNLIHDNHSQHHLNHSYNQIISKAVQNCINTFGFSSNPLLHTWENAYTTLSSTTQFDYFNRIQNSTFHNLCTSHTPPPNLGRTLGLGLKFCIQTPYPQNTMDFERFGRDARLKYIFAGEDSLQYNNTPKRLIVKSSWIPGPQADILEHKINKFTNTLEKLHTQHCKLVRRGSNLTNLQKFSIPHNQILPSTV